MFDKLLSAGVVVTGQRAYNAPGEYLASIYRTDDTGAQHAAIGYGPTGTAAVEAAAKEAIKLGWLKAEEVQ